MDNSTKALVHQLNDLSQNDQVLLEVVRAGRDATPYLVDFLFSAPSLHPQPRCLAAEALGMMGGPQAVEALIAVLSKNSQKMMSPQLWLSEKAIRNRACLELGRLQATNAIPALMLALQENRLEGSAYALTELGVREAIPWLIECLEEDSIRNAVSECLVHFVPEAFPCLRQTVWDIRIIDGVELASSSGRRAEAARLLGDLDFDASAVILLKLLRDCQAPVRFNAALALAHRGDASQKKEALTTLLEFQERGCWLEQNLSKEAILSMGKIVLAEACRHCVSPLQANRWSWKSCLALFPFDSLKRLMGKSKSRETLRKAG
jgi:HEAT repeat protein